MYVYIYTYPYMYKCIPTHPPTNIHSTYTLHTYIHAYIKYMQSCKRASVCILFSATYLHFLWAFRLGAGSVNELASSKRTAKHDG